MIALLLLLDVYHVSPEGNDANDGKSPQKAWKTVAKVNAAAFQPGDQVLFARGGEWRESLKAGSSGAPGKPIVFAAYGKGAKPKFWGSDLLRSADFKPAGGKFTLAIADWNFTSGDPKLGDDFAPKPGSPVIGAAKVDAGRRPATDQAGRKRPEACSIGAREPGR